MMHTYKARVKAGGQYHTVTVEAHNSSAAKELLEAQYGRGNVDGVPLRK
jgi:IS1 family transposase